MYVLTIKIELLRVVYRGQARRPQFIFFFINDIVNNINSDIAGIFTVDEFKLFIILFADDAVLFAQTPDALNYLLNNLENYCRTWGLKIPIKQRL